MAINDGDRTEGATQHQERPREQAHQQQQNSRSPFSGMSFSQPGRVLGSPLGPSKGSEYLSTLNAEMLKVFQHGDPAMEISLHSMDNANEGSLYYSLIVISAHMPAQPEKGVAYHTLVIEATAPVPDSVPEMVNNRRIEVPRFASNALTEGVAKSLHKLMAGFYAEKLKMPENNIILVPTDSTVVPRELDPKDENSVFNLCYNIGLALGTELSVLNSGGADFNLMEMPKDSNLAINIAFQNAPLVDAVGQPMRGDVLINFTSQSDKQQTGRNRYELGGEQTSKKISELAGFLDLVYAPAEAPQGFFNPYRAQQQQQLSTQLYVARMVLTNLESNFSYTPASVLLGIYAALSMQENNNWIQYYKPTSHGKGKIDYKDIGALNAEAILEDPAQRLQGNFGSRIDTKAESFGLPQLGMLIAALIRPGIMISIDVPRCGPQSWYLGVFAAAASNNRAAMESIVRTANTLTGGAFGRYYDSSQPMFVDTNNPIYMGYYYDDEDQKRDIRDIDYLYVANRVCDTNPALIRDWSDTFMDGPYQLIERLQGRREIINEITKNKAVFTGIAERVTFSANFLRALSMGIQETGLSLTINTPLAAAQFNDQRASAGFIANGMLDSGQHAFNLRQQVGGGNQQWGFQQFGMQRWR